MLEMDFLKAEIARKKKQLEESDVLAPNKKYFKRGDLAAKQEEEYWKKHKRFKADSEKSNGDDSQDGLDNDGAQPGSSRQEEKHMLPRKEVIRRLRERMEPIILFGESEYEAYQRLRRLEIMEPEVNRGFKNDFKAAMDKVDEEYLQEILKAGGEKEDSKANDVKAHDDGTTMEQIHKLAERLGTGDEKLDSEVVLKYVKFVLKEWANDLNSRPDDEKRSFKGKLASATHGQTVTYLKPLLRKLKKAELPSEILSCMVDIVRFLLDRNYLKAYDAYLEMAIGNAPWPIGVTMVGIHARTGREKIFARNVAHVLNDETQRKYIQALKRIMTQAQKYFPTDPSRSVNFDGPNNDA